MIPFKKIKILSQGAALELVSNFRDEWNVVSLWADEKPIFEGHKNILYSNFHDIIEPEKNKILCTAKHISEILDFSKKCYNDNLLIHCYAGICRSTAITFLIILDSIKEKSEFPTEDAINLLTKIRPMAYPNRHILELGMRIIAPDYKTEIEWWRALYNSNTFRRLMGG